MQLREGRIKDTWVKDSGNGKRIFQEEVKRVNKNRGGKYGLV